MREVQAAASTLGLEATTVEIRASRDIAPGFDALKGRAEGPYVCMFRSWKPTAFASTP